MNIDPFTLYGGSPIYMRELDLNIHQPRLQSISEMGEEAFYTALGFVLIDGGKVPVDGGEEIELSAYMMLLHLILANPSILEPINQLGVMFFNRHWAIDENTLQLKLKPIEDVEVPSSFLEEIEGLAPEDLNNAIEAFYAEYETIIPEAQWEDLCAILREISKVKEKPKPKKKARSAKAQAILDKISAAQEKIDKGKESKGFKPFLWDSVSTLSTGDGVPISEIIENYTILQLTDQLTRLLTREESEKQFAMMLEGVKLEKPLVSWMGTINKEL